MEVNVTAPVLLIAFNRPDTTKKVFERIQIAKPAKFYVALDGSRDEVVGEDKLCKDVQNIVKNIDWPCDVSYKINNNNKGAEVTVSSAIAWVFENEESVIILEDDIIAPLSFFKFAQEMLEKYKDEERIGTITGSNFTPISQKNASDYFFAKYGHSWGWATWKRTWDNFDLNVTIPDKHLNINFLKKITNSINEARYYQRKFKQINRNGSGNSTWDNIGLYYHRISNSLSIIPRVNLTSNIGVFGLHAQGETEHHFRPFDENFEIKKYPEKIECNTDFDKYHFKTYINRKKPLYKRVINKVLHLLRI